jgi:hypothetical protein
MLVLPTAKTLFFIATHLGFGHAPMIYATSPSESYVWTATPTGYTLLAKGFPSSDFTTDPDQTLEFKGTPPTDGVPPEIHVITNYGWKRDSAYVFDNGDRIEKSGDHAFYILNAGGANEKVFTILFPPGAPCGD